MTVDNKASSACAEVGNWRSTGAAVAPLGRTGGSAGAGAASSSPASSPPSRKATSVPAGLSLQAGVAADSVYILGSRLEHAHPRCSPSPSGV